MDKSSKVDHGNKQSSATITAVMADGVTRTCLVHNSVIFGTSSFSGSGFSIPSTLSLNQADFILEAGRAFQVKMSGTFPTLT